MLSSTGLLTPMLGIGATYSFYAKHDLSMFSHQLHHAQLFIYPQNCLSTLHRVGLYIFNNVKHCEVQL